MLGHFLSTEKSQVGFLLLYKKLEPCLYRGSTVVVQRADNAEVAGPNPAPGTRMLENRVRLTALTESIDQNQMVNDIWLNDYSSLR